MKRKTKAESIAPLSDVVFQLLVILHDGERHGYRLAKQLQGKLGKRRIAPGNLYRTLRSMLDQGLIEESGWRPDPGIDDERRRYFCITDRGRQATRSEALRLESLLESARSRRILEPKGEASR